jgi:uncharacterized protein
LILEGIVTTLNADGSVNLSPMGPEVDDTMRQLVLKPYRSSTTYQNLKRAGAGVFHVTDDVELLAQAAVSTPEPAPEMMASTAVEGRILSNACRWYAFGVQSLDDREDRTRIVCEVVDHGSLREFFGFNRAKHAVLEAAILATRIDFLPADHIAAEFERLRPMVDKTGGPAERRAFDFLHHFVQARVSASHA